MEPIELPEFSTDANIADVINLGLDIAGVDTPSIFDVVIEPLSKVFGEGSDRDIRLPALDTSALEGSGLAFNGAGGIKADSNRRAGRALQANFDAINRVKSDLMQRAVTLGLAPSTVGDVFNAIYRVPTSHQDAINIQQSLVNALGGVASSFNKLEADRTNFLIENPKFQKSLDLFVSQNPQQKEAITGSFFALLKNKDNQSEQSRLTGLTGKSDAELKDLIFKSQTKPAAKPKLDVPFQRAVPQNINVNIPPVKVIVNQPQSTLGISNFPQLPTQPAKQQTKSNWYQNLKQKVSTGIKVASRVKSAIEFPFFIHDTFFKESDPLETLFFGESGDVFFPELPGFPINQPQPEFVNFTKPLPKPENANIKLGKLDKQNDTIFAQLSPAAKTLLPLLLGLIVTTIILKKRG